MLRVLVGAVGQFAREACAAHYGLALHHLASLAGCLAGSGGKHYLLDDGLGLHRILLEIALESR